MCHFSHELPPELEEKFKIEELEGDDADSIDDGENSSIA